VNSRDVLEFLGVDQDAIHFRHVGLGQQADEARFRLHAIVRQDRDSDALFDGMGVDFRRELTRDWSGAWVRATLGPFFP
jgi:hypothetical protein